MVGESDLAVSGLGHLAAAPPSAVESGQQDEALQVVASGGEAGQSDGALHVDLAGHVPLDVEARDGGGMHDARHGPRVDLVKRAVAAQVRRDEADPAAC